MQKKILILGQDRDVHIEEVSNALNEMGARVILSDRTSPLSTNSIRIGVDGMDVVFETEGGERLKGKEIDAVWWRVKPQKPAEFGLPSSVEEAFKWKEWRAMLRSLPFLMKDAFWVNNPIHITNSSLKIRQLNLASKLGFKVPRTLVTNDSRSLDYLAESPETIYKTLSSFVAPPNQIIFTNKISLNDAKSSPESIKLAPCLFQSYVDKQYEVRVTVVGGDVFCSKINSQETKDTEVDWRKNQFEGSIYEYYELDPQEEERLLRLHKELQLEYGAYDFIRDKEGELIFLECNPSGQWLWQEHHIEELQISKHLAMHLCNGGKS